MKDPKGILEIDYFELEKKNPFKNLNPFFMANLSNFDWHAGFTSFGCESQYTIGGVKVYSITSLHNDLPSVGSWMLML